MSESGAQRSASLLAPLSEAELSELHEFDTQHQAALDNANRKAEKLLANTLWSDAELAARFALTVDSTSTRAYSALLSAIFNGAEPERFVAVLYEAIDVSDDFPAYDELLLSVSGLSDSVAVPLIKALLIRWPEDTELHRMFSAFSESATAESVTHIGARR